jgi:hypothetical protein
MDKTKPFVIDYRRPRVLIGCEIVDLDGNVFKSPKALREAREKCEVSTNSIVFCPHCGAGNRHEMWGFPYTPNKQKEVTHKGQCPNCGERLSLRYSYDIEYSNAVTAAQDDPIQISPVRGKTAITFPSQLKWWPVQDDKLAVETVSDLYFSRTMRGNYWLQHEVVRYRLIYNLNTGLCYSMRGIDKDGNPSMYSVQNNRLQNRTMAPMVGIPNEMEGDFIEVVLNAIKNYKGINYNKIINPAKFRSAIYVCAGNKISVNILSRVNYFADMKHNDLRDMLDMEYQGVSEGSKRAYKKLISLSKDGETEWLPKYMQKRSIRNRLNKRAFTFFMYKWLYACGVRDVNIMNRIVDKYIDVYDASYDGEDKYYDQTKLSLSKIVKAHCINADERDVQFMRWVLRGRNADSVYHFIISIFNTNDFLFSDSARMYKLLTDVNYELPENTGTLKEIHDNLSRLNHKRKYSNLTINYSEDEQNLEMDCRGYSFRLAKDTDALYDIGKALSICVGSYGRDAAAKKCTIVTMSKNDKYVACIELKVNKKNMVMKQLKGRFNHTVQEIAPVTEWVAATGVNAQCYDYQNAVDHKNNRFDDCNHDYHVENPRLRERVAYNANIVFDDGPLPF